ncbi:MAG TPA: PP2C family serine/threonine-protein phosphatase [Candidatus Paceibacterota bacterium]|nr:MAG: hypothetical protein BWY12_01405 [candidate division BRC1 bacterium ADurb.Bin183]HOE64525.1 PP2C family serine/threonine-protein phosphatase [Candidatus Sumerlaeota bacterium]HRR30048.1 PP2C family serine/threonine-protein phosphatase [Candidatus Sumerlaeia bacterium]HRU33736.1 PP2C family serine/threonine-protein phosphatase [Candidatus Paceibacterota bacterium]HON51246.1 PP2C family serine/threonine-protein phosphatase [Candidatus Sumerlaeota bacterium]
MDGQLQIENAMWRYAAAKSTGKSHIKSGLPCQDSFSCALIENNVLILAVADGAGSAPMSDLGAETSVQTLIRVISDQIKTGNINYQEIIKTAAIDTQNTIYSIAKEKSIHSRDLASTLLAVIVGDDGGAALQIGDGLIAVRENEKSWCWVFWPQHGEFVNTTRFITDDDAMDFIQIDVLPPIINDIILLSDGLENLALDIASKQIFDPFFSGLISPLHLADGVGEILDLSSKLEGFLKSERITARTDDDTSLIIATRYSQLIK